MKKKLSDLLKDISQIEIKGFSNVWVKGLTQDSRKVKDGYAFIAIRGHTLDGHLYVDKAIESGAAVIAVESWPEILEDDIVYIRCKDSRILSAAMASAFYDHPSKEIKVVGVTGTNGKTTVTTMLYDLFKELGYKVGLISTIEIRIGDDKLATKLTTPDAITLQDLFYQMVNAGCTYAFMEVSSHAVHQNRVGCIDFAGGVFTNITHDHLDYHGTFKEYIRVKKLFFDDLSPHAFALFNVDDKNGSVMVQNSAAKVHRFGLRKLVEFKGKILEMDASGLFLEINGRKIMSRLIGMFNAYNLLAVYGVAVLLEVAEEEQILECLSALGPVDGRFELIHSGPSVVVDYAHTPDALKNVLGSIRKIKTAGRIISVLGCGGDRDKKKRPIMGRLALSMSDMVVFTSDNPRNEDPISIINDMKLDLTREDLKRLIEITDRAMAIRTALALAGEKDVVLIAGKGHEDYQEIRGERFFFSDKKIVKDILSKDI